MRGLIDDGFFKNPLANCGNLLGSAVGIMGDRQLFQIAQWAKELDACLILHVDWMFRRNGKPLPTFLKDGDNSSLGIENNWAPPKWAGIGKALEIAQGMNYVTIVFDVSHAIWSNENLNESLIAIGNNGYKEIIIHLSESDDEGEHRPPQKRGPVDECLGTLGKLLKEGVFTEVKIIVELSPLLIDMEGAIRDTVGLICDKLQSYVHKTPRLS